MRQQNFIGITSFGLAGYHDYMSPHPTKCCRYTYREPNTFLIFDRRTKASGFPLYGLQREIPAAFTET